jgi:hypothetical protein
VISLIWKEWRENLKWAAVPSILILGPMAVFGVPMLLESKYLAYVSLVAALSGALLGFLQVYSEAMGDKRSVLLHRPLSRSGIFLAKVIAGVGLYLLALLTPTAIAVVLAATPGHVAAPFEWGMAVPWLVDVFMGLVYYFAGMLVAQRQARWYASRCLPLAAGLFASILVWNVTELWHALMVLGLMSGVVALGAWGSIFGDGALGQQPRWARLGLTGTLLTGLVAIGFGAKVMIAREVLPLYDYFPFEMGRRGDILVVQKENDSPDGRIQSITDLSGQVPLDLEGERLDNFAFIKVITRAAMAGIRPKTISYRSRSRYLLEFKNKTKPSKEDWWFAPTQGRFVGYDKDTKRLIGSFGPDGFADPDQSGGEKFLGDVCSIALHPEPWVRYPIAFPYGVYTVDFRTGKVQKLFSPPYGDKAVWASEREDEREKWFHIFVGTEKTLHVFDQSGAQVFTALLPAGLKSYRQMLVGRFDNPRRYWLWHVAKWQIPVSIQDTMDEVQLVTYDHAGNEILPRKTVPPRPGAVRDGVRPTAYHAFSGLVTPPVELIGLVGAKAHLDSAAQAEDREEISRSLQFFTDTTQLYIPGITWDLRARPGLGLSFAGLMLLASVCSCISCFVLIQRSAFSAAQRLEWAACGLLFGPYGLLLMVVLLDRPASVPCPSCRKSRVVTRERCEHCGAAHAVPRADGTEILEPVKAISEPALTTCDGGRL